MVETTVDAGLTRPIAPPGEVRALARARREARLARDWATADRLKAEIEAAGWLVVDHGADYALVPAAAPDRTVDGNLLYGSAASVPSLLEHPAGRGVSLVVLMPDPARTPGALPGGYDEEVVVVRGPEPLVPPAGESRAADGTPAADLEIVRLDGEPTLGSLLAAGIRRVGAELVVVCMPGLGAIPDPSLLVRALADPTVACVGTAGGRTGDLRSFAPIGEGDADLLLAGAIAFRRADLAARLPIEERLAGADRLAQWLSLALRCPPGRVEGSGTGREPADGLEPAAGLEPAGGLEPAAGSGLRRALVVPGPRTSGTGEDAPGSRRDFYRLLERFGRVEGLLSGGG